MKEINNNYANDKYKTINSEKHMQNPYQASDDEHCVSTVRLLNIRKLANGTCGFHLTRTKWDPYPWVSAVDVATPAERCGLKAGDCVLEVNGEDVLGLRISEIANLIQCQFYDVTLLLWNSGCHSDDCTAESLCRAPMPRSLQRLSVVVQSILSIIECPICLETIRPPTMQCQNGHLLCMNCRIKAAKCPVCRDHYTPRRALIAEEIYTHITNAFNLCRNEDKLRQKLFPAQQQQYRPTMQQSNNFDQQEKIQLKNVPSDKLLATPKQQKGKMNQQRLPANKFLQKLLHRKTYSMDNILTSEISTLTTSTHMPTVTTTKISKANNSSTDSVAKKLLTSQSVETISTIATPLQKSCTSQLINMTNDSSHLTAEQATQRCNMDAKLIQPTTTTAKSTTSNPLKPNKTLAANKNLAKHYSLSVNDLHQAVLSNDHFQLGQVPHQVIVTETPEDDEEELLSLSLLDGNSMTTAHSHSSVQCLKAITPCTCYVIATATTPSSNKLLYLGKRRPCTLPNNCNAQHQQQRQVQDVFNISTHSSLSSGINASTDSEFSAHSALASTKTPTSSPALTTITTATMISHTPPTKISKSPCSGNCKLLSASTSTFTETTTTTTLATTTASLPSISSLSACTSSSIVKLTEAPVVPNSSPVMTLKTLPSTSQSSHPPPPSSETNALTVSSPAIASPASSTSSNATGYCTPTYHNDEQCAAEQLQLKQKFHHYNYRCPCACVASFNASSALQEHIKTAHHLPIVNFGTSKAKLALPLRPPIDNAILILELSNQCSNEACQVAEAKKTEIFANQIENVANIKADKTCNSNKECWLRLKLNGQECIELTLMLQAAINESCNILMTT